MMNSWQLQDAKNRFSEVVKKALSQGPQTVTKRGIETVVVISVDEYRRLKSPKTGLVDFFRQSPLAGTEIDLSRSKEADREVSI